MHFVKKTFFLSVACALFVACTGNTANGENSQTDNVPEATDAAPVDVAGSGDNTSSLLIHDEQYTSAILLDADGNVCQSARSILSNNQLLTYHYQRVGCINNSTPCDQEFVTYAAVQYPHDSLLQVWMADVLSHYYYDVTRQLDIIVNGERNEDNGEGELVLKNRGCQPYEGILSDGGKSLFDYYQARVWVIGRDRGELHGPAGRYGCAIYRCWQSADLVTYFVGYSTDEPQWPVHYLCSFDRHDGHQLDLTDLVRDDYIPELYDLLAEEARTRHYILKNRNQEDLAIEFGNCDYSSLLEIKSVAFTAEGLAVSTGSLAFDQWASASHILILPYERVNHLLNSRYRR